MINNNDLEQARDYILFVISNLDGKLSQDTVSAVMHYVRYNEIEMAFEGLFLDIIEEKLFSKELDLYKTIEIAKDLNLDKESVFDVNFWEKLVKYLGNVSNEDIPEK